jgi:hypothetical protein
VNRCAFCNSTILFGGRRVGEYVFCNSRCLLHGRPFLQADQQAAVADLNEALRELRDDLLLLADEVQQLRTAVGEANERVDFTERALVQLREAIKPPPAAGR